MTEITHTIMTINLAYLLELVAGMNKRAAKLGCALITAVVVGAPRMKHNPAIGSEVSYTDLSITGETPKLDGWILLATIEHTDDGNLLRTVPRIEADLTEYRTADPLGCDHCNTRRHRRDTFVVQHDDGRRMRVGRQCLRDFLGHKSVDQLVFLAESLSAINDVCESDEIFGDPMSSSVDLVEYLGYVVATIRMDGWMSRSAANASYDPLAIATADLALENLYDNMKRDRRPEVTSRRPTGADRAAALAAIEYVAADLEAADTITDYQHNLSVIISAGTVDHRRAGYAASIVAYHQRAMAELARREKAGALKESAHVGAVKERITVRVTLLRHRVTYGSYGATHIYAFCTPEGSDLVWFASRRQDIDVGDVIDLTGTVKDHGEYNGRAQTIVTRCKVAPVDAAAA